MRRPVVLLLWGIVGAAQLASAGVYLGSVDSNFEANIIVHSPGYNGLTGPVITVGICIDPTAAQFASSVDWAVKTWNERRAMLNNCDGPAGSCQIADALPCTVANGCTCNQVPFPPDRFPCTPWIFSAGGTVVHELGHCAFGLGHNNWVSPTAGTTSFTNTKLATAMNDGTDNIRGSGDDTPTPNPGSLILHWFRTLDNDPFVIDTTTIMNNDSYSRNRFDLPFTDLWPASANFKVAGPTELNAGRTQAIMTGMTSPNSYETGLAADDVNTVHYAFSGLHPDAATTSDDYEVELVVEPTCDTAVIKILGANLTTAENALGLCEAALDGIPNPPLALAHYQLVPRLIYSHILITMDTSPVASGTWRYVVMNDGFETGGAEWWSDFVP